MGSNIVPCVSVIIPTCRRPALLKEAIRSVLAQTFRDFELIVVDDETSSSGKAAVQAFADERITYMAHDKSRGGSAARNTGLNKARARLVTFLDDDDMWQPQFLARMTETMSGLPAKVGVLHCAVEFLDARGEKKVSTIDPSHRGDVHQAVLKGERSVVSTIALIRREVFERCGGFDEELPSAQDWDMWIRASREFYFEYIPDVLAVVRVYGARVSSDPLRPIVSRERILEKYAQEFAQAPEARALLLKRLGKLNVLVGRWEQAWDWFRAAARGRPGEWLKTFAWLAAQKDFFYPAATVVAALGVAWYAQGGALSSTYLINDDVCQHIWWMRVFRDSGLFPQDLLLEYARSLQNFGILALYRLSSLVMDPVAFTKVLPFILFPLAAWGLFRLVVAWTKDHYTGFVTALALMVTPIYMQHMTGGHAHAFGFVLLILFLYFFMVEKYRAAFYMMLLAVCLFPVVFVLAAGYGLLASARVRSSRRMMRLGVGIGALILAVKFVVMHDPVIGSPLMQQAVARMPELTAAGRWDIWPVPFVGQALFTFAQSGLFLFRASHGLFYALVFMSAVWWWQRRRDVSLRPLGILLAVSVLFYLVAQVLLLKIYAPDRYVAYSVTLASLLFIMVPAGMLVSAWPRARERRLIQVLLVLIVLSWVGHIRNAGLTDYSANSKLYAFLATLPKDALIAAYPDTADGIPVFSRRSVLVNQELSVPLFDRYWAAVKARTFDLLGAYYAPDAGTVRAFCRRYGVTHLVVERRRFRPEFLKGRVYFEPFGSWTKARLKAGQVFFLNKVPPQACVWAQGDVCVMDASKWE